MVRFGILGAGNIAHRFAQSLAHEHRAELMAASCRSQQKALTFLDEMPHAAGARAYGSHSELLEDPEIDAIYLALPHAHHEQWAIAALRAKKAVLCEKPACLDANQMRAVARAARENETLFMEAMKPRFAPLYAQVTETLNTIGPLVRVEATLCNDMLGSVRNSGSYHMTPGPGAGVLLDCGTYCASWIEALCPGKPTLTSIEYELEDGIDVYANAWLDFGGVAARLECAFDRAKPRVATIVGEHGSVVIDMLHRPQHATITLSDAEPQELSVPYHIDDFFGEIRHFVDLVSAGFTESPTMPLEASVRCACILDTIRSGLQ